MWTTLFKPLNRHFIDRGRVGCPAAGSDVDFDSCSVCPALLETSVDAKPPYIRCKPVHRVSRRIGYSWTQRSA